MEHYFAGYHNGVPVVFCDDNMGFVRISHKKRRTIQSAHNVAKIWNAHVRKKSKKCPDTVNDTRANP